MKPAQLAAVAVLGVVAWRVYVAMQPDTADTQDQGALQDDGWLTKADDILSGAAQTVDEWTGGMLKISAMARVDRSLLNNANVQAMLQVIRSGEGTTGPDGFKTLYGGGQFSSLADHPRVAVTKWGRTSTAAGAFQLLSKVWDETRAIMQLPDFGIISQQLAALGRIAARGALPDVISGNFESAIRKLNKEWASLPESPYGQTAMTMDKARAIFTANGGSLA